MQPEQNKVSRGVRMRYYRWMEVLRLNVEAICNDENDCHRNRLQNRLLILWRSSRWWSQTLQAVMSVCLSFLLSLAFERNRVKADLQVWSWSRFCSFCWVCDCSSEEAKMSEHEHQRSHALHKLPTSFRPICRMSCCTTLIVCPSTRSQFSIEGYHMCNVERQRKTCMTEQRSQDADFTEIQTIIYVKNSLMFRAWLYY